MNLNITKLYLRANKPLFASVAILGLLAMTLSQIIFPLTAQAADPAFNTFTPYTHTQTYNHDYYLLDVKNDTKGTDWNFPVSADADDVLTFYLYYHNSSNYTTANNTTLRVNLPSGQSANQSVTGYLWADNATNATAANPLNQSVQVNLSTSQSLQYVAGSAKWYPNQADWRYASATSFPNDQPDTQLFSSGINIGSINGCWEYSGAIVFKARVGSTTSSQDLSVNKLVRNQTTGQTSYVNSTSAYAGDRLNFQVQITNTGNVTLSNVIVRDQLPYQLTYVTGSTQSDGGYVADGISSGGINIGSLNAGAVRTLTFDATANSSYSSQNVTNTAYARADSVSERSFSASIYLSPVSSPLPSPSGGLSIAKTVRNQNYSYGSYGESASAISGERVTFQIQISNNSNFTANNVIVWDNLPSGLSYIPGTARLDSGYVADSLISSGGVNIGSIYSGATRTIVFDASVSSVDTGYNQTLTNYAYVRADQLNEINDPATVYVSQQTTYYSNLTLTKMVRNLSTNQTGLTTSTNASVGDRLMFTLQLVTPVGSNQYNQVNNIRVWDILPAGLTYVAGTARMDGGLVNDTLVSGNGINVGTMFSNQTKTITFEATVNSYGAGQTMTNYAYASADGLAQQSAFAQINTGSIITTPVVTPIQTQTPTPAVLGASVRAVTGADDWGLKAAASTMTALWAIFILYVLMEHADFWRDKKLQFVLWKLRLKERNLKA